MRGIVGVPAAPRAVHFTLPVARRTGRPRKRVSGDRGCSRGAGLDVKA